MIHKLLLPLDTSIRNLAHLVGIELAPFATVKLDVERDNVTRCNEVDERVPDVALVLEIDGQVEKIKAAAIVLLQRRQQHFSRVLVRDVADHERGPHVAARSHFLQD